jgi:lipid-binding SYLF domain-containing protein
MRASILLLLASILAVAANKNAERLTEATTVLVEVMASPDRAIPKELLDKAHCIAVVPGFKKGAFIVGASYGKGYLSCRQTGKAGWSAPATIRVESGSVGLQIGGTETDLVMLVMNKRGADSLMQSKFTIGGTVQAAAGPVGRSSTAETDAAMRAEILSYSRARGLFAGVALQGATLRADLDSNKAMYKRPFTTVEIVRERKAKATATGQKFISTITRYSPKELK